jgi:hypothetical protein
VDPLVPVHDQSTPKEMMTDKFLGVKLVMKLDGASVPITEAEAEEGI